MWSKVKKKYMFACVCACAFVADIILTLNGKRAVCSVEIRPQLISLMGISLPTSVICIDKYP